MGRRSGKRGAKHDSSDDADGCEATPLKDDGTLKCFKCGETGHVQSKCPRKGARAMAKRKCFICGQAGHTRRECPGIEDNGSGQSKHRNSKSTARKARQNKSDDDGGGEGSERPIADTVVALLDAKIPLVDMAVFPLALATNSATEAILPYDNSEIHLSMILEELGGPKAPALDIYGAMYCDPEVLLPEMGSPHFGLWERFQGDPKARLAFGLGYASAHLWKDEHMERFERCLCFPNTVAVGVCGLSYGAEPDSVEREAQLRLFITMAKAAVSKSLPFIFEMSAGASADAERILSTVFPADARLCLHCMGVLGDLDVVARLMRSFPDMVLSATPVVSFAKGKTARDMLFEAPLNRIVLSSCTPLTRPKPFPGGFAERTEFATTASLIDVALAVAELKQTPAAEVLLHARNAANVLFKLGLPDLPKDPAQDPVLDAGEAKIGGHTCSAMGGDARASSKAEDIE
eukprot:m.106268 g.106268  ORF g.106268 m.106268 type:complete len:462 (+) comp10578_c0_seq3:255-1640(+)